MPIIIIFIIFFLTCVDFPEITRWYEGLGYAGLYSGICIIYATCIGAINLSWFSNLNIRPNLNLFFCHFIWPLTFLVPMLFFYDIEVYIPGVYIYAVLSIVLSCLLKKKNFDYITKGRLDNPSFNIYKIDSDMDLFLWCVICSAPMTLMLFLIK